MSGILPKLSLVQSENANFIRAADLISFESIKRF